jgi:hypothetical protein
MPCLLSLRIEPLIVLPVRHPAEVICSIRERDGLPSRVLVGPSHRLHGLTGLTQPASGPADFGTMAAIRGLEQGGASAEGFKAGFKNPKESSHGGQGGQGGRIQEIMNKL